MKGSCIQSRLWTCLSVSALLIALFACGEVDVVVAQATCEDSEDCASGTFCSKPSCGASVGVCEPFPATCGSDQSPVCGCDGVVYWNDCLRQRDGVAASTQGTCVAMFAVCHGPPDCPVGDAVCNMLSVGVDNGCGPPQGGGCWVLPDECPTSGAPKNWQSCGGGPPMCVDFCTAIRAATPYQPRGGACQ